jgi:flagellar hook-associated protein 3 FlgL
MIQALNSIANNFITNINLTQQSLTNVSNEVTSGYRVTQASDSPSEVGSILQVNTELAQTNQAVSNLTLVQGQVTTAQTALQTGESLIENALTLGAQGASSTVTAATRSDIAQQLQQLQAQMVGVANTTYDGSYVFSGDNSQSPSYQLNWTGTTPGTAAGSAPGVTRLQLSNSTALVEDAGGNQFSVSESAQNIFDHRDASDNPDTSNVFAGISNLATALTGGNSTAISTAISNLQTAQSYYSQQLASAGNAVNRVSSALTDAQTQVTQLKTNLSSLRDTDVTSAITEMTQLQTQEQAQITAQAQISNKSLFDMLG